MVSASISKWGTQGPHDLQSEYEIEFNKNIQTTGQKNQDYKLSNTGTIWTVK